MAAAVRLLLILSLLVCAPQAAAITIIDPVGHIVQPYQRWAAQSHVPTVPRRVTVWVHKHACDGEIDACSSAFGGIEMDSTYFNLANPEYRIDARSTLLHELGHQFDYFEMTDQARDRFRRLIRDPRPYRPINVQQANPPYEKFAEAYMLCAWIPRGVSLRDAMVGYDYRPSRATHRKICDMIRRLGVAHL